MAALIAGKLMLVQTYSLIFLGERLGSGTADLLNVAGSNQMRQELWVVKELTRAITKSQVNLPLWVELGRCPG